VDWKPRVPVLAASLWWGSLTAIGFVAVPLLFAHLATPADAGRMAAKLFTAQTWISVACGVLLLMSSRAGDEAVRMDWARGALMFVIAGLLFALLAEFAIAPRIVARENPALWHGAGTALYGLQWVCALIVVWKLSSRA
jgi:hypothetical protein